MPENGTVQQLIAQCKKNRCNSLYLGPDAYEHNLNNTIINQLPLLVIVDPPNVTFRGNPIVYLQNFVIDGTHFPRSTVEIVFIKPATLVIEKSFLRNVEFCTLPYIRNKPEASCPYQNKVYVTSSTQLDGVEFFEEVVNYKVHQEDIWRRTQ